MNDTQPLCKHCNTYLFNRLDINRGMHMRCEIEDRKDELNPEPPPIPYVTSFFWNPTFNEVVLSYDLSLETEEAILTFKDRKLFEECLNEEGLVFIGLLD